MLLSINKGNFDYQSHKTLPKNASIYQKKTKQIIKHDNKYILCDNNKAW